MAIYTSLVYFILYVILTLSDLELSLYDTKQTNVV